MAHLKGKAGSEMKVHFVDVGDGAQMTFPVGEFCHQMRYGQNADIAAASALDSYRYLVLECTKEEAWKRIKLIRKAAFNEARNQH